jgi:hypothetical protein
MIITEKIQALQSWLQENRPDKESKKPYFITEKVDGYYHLPKDALIERGLMELGQPYSIVIYVKGISIEIESKDFDE